MPEGIPLHRMQSANFFWNSFQKEVPFRRTHILAKVYKCALPLKLQRSVYSNGSSSSSGTLINPSFSSSSFFCSDLLVPYESGLDSIESTKTIYYHCIRLSFLRPHITKRSEGKIQWANAKNFIFLFLSLTYTKEERCFYKVLEKIFLFLCKKIAIRLHS